MCGLFVSALKSPQWRRKLSAALGTSAAVLPSVECPDRGGDQEARALLIASLLIKGVPMPPRHITVGKITIGNDLPMVFIIGPNAMESRAHALEMSAALKEIAAKYSVALIYKTSFDKANRTSIAGARGLGLKESLPILAEI